MSMCGRPSHAMAGSQHPELQRIKKSGFGHASRCSIVSKWLLQGQLKRKRGPGRSRKMKLATSKIEHCSPCLLDSIWTGQGLWLLKGLSEQVSERASE